MLRRMVALLVVLAMMLPYATPVFALQATVTERVREGRQLMSAGDIEAAQAILTELESQSLSSRDRQLLLPYRFDVKLARAGGLLKSGEIEAGLAQAHEVMTLDPSRSESVARMLDKHATGSTEVRRAILDFYRDAIRRHGSAYLKLPAFHKRAADLAIDLGRPEEAVDSLEFLVFSNPKENLAYRPKLAEAFRSIINKRPGQKDPQSPAAREDFRWLSRAARAGDDSYMALMANCYEVGYGVEQDLEKAVRFYREAAERGNPIAMRQLGMCYEAGNGIAKDPATAVRYYRKASEMGDAQSMFRLAVCLATGNGVGESEAEALRWLRSSQNAGYAPASKALVAYNEALAEYRARQAELARLREIERQIAEAERARQIAQAAEARRRANEIRRRQNDQAAAAMLALFAIGMGAALMSDGAGSSYQSYDNDAAFRDAIDRSNRADYERQKIERDYNNGWINSSERDSKLNQVGW